MARLLKNLPSIEIENLKRKYFTRGHFWVENSKGCWKLKSARSGSRVYRSVKKCYGTAVSIKRFISEGDKQHVGFSSVNTHVLMYFLHTGQTAETARSETVSHLCSESECVNPQHLTLEPQVVNLSRVRCCRTRRCSGHGDYKDCLLVKVGS